MCTCVGKNLLALGTRQILLKELIEPVGHRLKFEEQIKSLSSATADTCMLFCLLSLRFRPTHIFCIRLRTQTLNF